MRALGALALAALAVAAAACDRKKGVAPAAAVEAAAERPARGALLLGHVTPLTGDQAASGQSTDRGVRLAVNEQNAKGGVKGRLVEVKTLDDHGKAEEAAVAATRLASQERVTVLLGESASSRSLAMASIADTYGVPMISPSSTSPRVTRDGDKVRPYVFRVCYLEPFEGGAMARFARETLKLERIAILRDGGDDGSVALADAFAAKLRELGGVVVADESYRAGDQDVRVQLGVLRAKDPQALYVPGAYAQVALVARQAREVGLTQPLLGGAGWDSAKLYELGGKALDGSYFSGHYAPDDPEPRVRDFVKRYEEAWGAAPDGLAATGYDAARVAMDAMARAGEPSWTAVRDALAQTKAFPGVTGAISIDAGHDAVKPATVLAVKNGAARYAAIVKPERGLEPPAAAPAPLAPKAKKRSPRPDAGTPGELETRTAKP